MSEHKCKYCGKELKNQGAVNLHELKCPQKPGVKECPPHDWRFLSPKVEKERRAIADGYSKVCKKCDELE
jgi:hypothetical protein